MKTTYEYDDKGREIRKFSDWSDEFNETRYEFLRSYDNEDRLINKIKRYTNNDMSYIEESKFAKNTDKDLTVETVYGNLQYNRYTELIKNGSVVGKAYIVYLDEDKEFDLNTLMPLDKYKAIINKEFPDKVKLDEICICYRYDGAFDKIIEYNYKDKTIVAEIYDKDKYNISCGIFKDDMKYRIDDNKDLKLGKEIVAISYISKNTDPVFPDFNNTDELYGLYCDKKSDSYICDFRREIKSEKLADNIIKSDYYIYDIDNTRVVSCDFHQASLVEDSEGRKYREYISKDEEYFEKSKSLYIDNYIINGKEYSIDCYCSIKDENTDIKISLDQNVDGNIINEVIYKKHISPNGIIYEVTIEDNKYDSNNRLIETVSNTNRYKSEFEAINHAFVYSLVDKDFNDYVKMFGFDDTFKLDEYVEY